MNGMNVRITEMGEKFLKNKPSIPFDEIEIRNLDVLFKLNNIVVAVVNRAELNLTATGTLDIQ